MHLDPSWQADWFALQEREGGLTTRTRWMPKERRRKREKREKGICFAIINLNQPCLADQATVHATLLLWSCDCQLFNQTGQAMPYTISRERVVDSLRLRLWDDKLRWQTAPIRRNGKTTSKTISNCYQTKVSNWMITRRTSGEDKYLTEIWNSAVRCCWH